MKLKFEERVNIWRQIAPKLRAIWPALGAEERQWLLAFSRANQDGQEQRIWEIVNAIHAERTTSQAP